MRSSRERPRPVFGAMMTSTSEAPWSSPRAAEPNSRTRSSPYVRATDARAGREPGEGVYGRMLSPQPVARATSALALDEAVGEEEPHGGLRRAERRACRRRELGETGALAPLGQRENQVERDPG